MSRKGELPSLVFSAIGKLLLVKILAVSALPFLHRFIFADLIGDNSAARSGGSADQGTFASSGESADYRSASCRAADHLGSGVVLLVMCALLADGAVMRCPAGGRSIVLRNRRDWESKDAAEGHERR